LPTYMQSAQHRFFVVSRIYIYNVVRIVHITVCYTNAYTDTQIDTCMQYTVTCAKHTVVCTHVRKLTHSHTTYIHTRAPASIRSIRRADVHPVRLCFDPCSHACVKMHVMCMICNNHMNVCGYFDQSVCFLKSSFDWKGPTKHRKQRIIYSNREPLTNIMGEKMRLKLRAR